MKFTAIDNETRLTQRDRTEDLSLDLVARLLTSIMTNQGEEIQVHARSQKFLYSPRTDMHMTGSEPLKINVEKSSAIEKESSVEFDLTGTIENPSGEKENCALYCFMWWDHLQASPVKNIDGGNFQGLSLYIDTGRIKTPLSDSTFELALHRKELLKQQEFLGQARGYLVFGRDS